MIILLWFAVCAAVLAATGMYGVVAESVAARKREIAIRLALGGPRLGVVRSMVSQTVQSALLGEAVGLLAAVPIYYQIAGLLYGVAPYIPLLFVLVLGFVCLVSFAASFWPAWSAVDRDSIELG